MIAALITTWLLIFNDGGENQPFRNYSTQAICQHLGHKYSTQADWLDRSKSGQLTFKCYEMVVPPIHQLKTRQSVTLLGKSCRSPIGASNLLVGTQRFRFITAEPNANALF
jgi:hypothetical protein